MMKNYITILTVLFTFIFSECNAHNPSDPGINNTAAGNVVQLSDEGFKKMIFNYEINKEWKFEGKKPAIIDFYADWCAPCRQFSPIVEQIASEYEGKIDVYKVDTEKETNLAQKLGITALPTLLFIPAKGKPQVAMGALPKEDLVNAINDILLNK